jgi:hypothetical protein
VILGLKLVRPGIEAPGPAAPTEPGDVNPPPPAETDYSPTVSKPPRQPVSPIRVHEKPALASPASANLITNWEDKVDQILAVEGEPDAKAKQMLELFPQLPADGQVEVARHLANLVSDEDYEPLRQLLTDPQLPEEVLDTLMADVLNRPNSLKLPALVEVARTTGHPKAANAKEVLGFFLEVDFGDDWFKWEERVQEWLKENPE